MENWVFFCCCCDYHFLLWSFFCCYGFGWDAHCVFLNFNSKGILKKSSFKGHTVLSLCWGFAYLLAIFSCCSGEKTSTKEWPSFLEIKGRVRLDAFEKFLQELPKSRSRAVMVSQVHLNCSKFLYFIQEEKWGQENNFLSRFLSSIYLFLLIVGSIALMEFSKALGLWEFKKKKKRQIDRT